MRWWRPGIRRRRDPLLSVIVPAYNVAAYLPACLDSLRAATYPHWEAVVVDDGSTDETAAIAAAYADRDRRLRLVRTENRGLGAARNEGMRHVRGGLVGFLDSDDVVPSAAYDVLAGSLAGTGSDFVTGSIVRWERDGLHEPPWMRRLHNPARLGIQAPAHPEILGDVFAWNKVFRRDFWESAGLRWPEGTRYEDQPTTTRAYLAGRFDVLPEVVYHWRIRDDGSSITQQRSSVADLRDRFATKRAALASVRAAGDPQVLEVFVDRVLAGDLHRYFVEVPGCSDEWWRVLHQGVVDLWGDRSLVHSGLPPVHRLCGWLVERGRREDAAALMAYAVGRGAGPLPHTAGPEPRLDLAAIGREAGGTGGPDIAARLHDVPLAALALRPHER